MIFKASDFSYFLSTLSITRKNRSFTLFLNGFITKILDNYQDLVLSLFSFFLLLL